jgi:hypothetical protein
MPPTVHATRLATAGLRGPCEPQRAGDGQGYLSQIAHERPAGNIRRQLLGCFADSVKHD